MMKQSVPAIILCLICSVLPADEIETDNTQTNLDVSWTDADNKIHHLSDSNGIPRLLHFWAAWCSPCREELPEMLNWQKENNDIEIITLSLDERIAQTKYFISKYKLTMPALLLSEESREKLEIPALPFTIFVLPDGSYHGHSYGAAPWSDADFSNQIREQFKLEKPHTIGN